MSQTDAPDLNWPKPPTLFRENGLVSVFHEPDARLLERLATQQVFSQHREEIRALYDKNAEVEWETQKMLWYTWQGEMLRRIHLWRRQEQHCELCGYRFNYTSEGKLKHENDWCRSHKTHCDKANGQQSCLDLQKAQEASKRRKQRQAPKDPEVKAQSTIAHHPNGTSKHH